MKPKQPTWKEKPARKKFVHNYIDKLKQQFFLTGWEITINYNLYPLEENPNVGAECKPTWNYRRATIEIYPPFWERNSVEEQEDILKHEFCHIILCQLLTLIDGLQKGQMVTDSEVHAANEHTTTWMASLIGIKK